MQTAVQWEGHGGLKRKHAGRVSINWRCEQGVVTGVGSRKLGSQVGKSDSTKWDEIRVLLGQVGWDICVADDETEGGLAMHGPPTCSLKSPCANIVDKVEAQLCQVDHQYSNISIYINILLEGNLES